MQRYEDLKDRVAVVTGGCMGIGHGIVQVLLAQQMEVIIFDIAPLPQDLLGAISYYVVDVSNRFAVENAVMGLHRPVDVLVNNAGIGGGDDWERVLGTNLNGPRFVTEALLPQMVARGNGKVIFITSAHTAAAFPGNSAYDASKHGLVGYMRTRAVELAAKGVRINAIAPGAIAGAGAPGKLSEADAAELSSHIPIARMGTTEEIGNVVAFLASEQSAYIVGAELRVDGGVAAMNSVERQNFPL